MEPTIITSAALAIGKLAYEGVISNRVDGLFCQYGNKVIKSITANLKAPENHDILKAMRRAQLNSTLIAVKSVSKKYKLWDKLTTSAPANLKEVLLYLNRELKNLDKGILNKIDTDNLHELDLSLVPRGVSTEERVQEFAATQKQNMVEELQRAKLAWVEIALKDAILNGWTAEGQELDWYTLACGFFAEELKTNPRLSAIIQTEYLADIKNDTRSFNENIDAFINRVESILPQAEGIIELIESNKEEIIKAISDVEEGTQKIASKIDQIDQKIDDILSGKTDNSPIEVFNHNMKTKLGLSPEKEKLSEVVLEYVNEQARFLYTREIYGDHKTNYDTYVWDEVFGPNEYKAESQFIATIAEDNQEVKLSATQAIADGEDRIWIVGDAGVGKTTTLYSIFFSMVLEGNGDAAPLLLQPQEFDSFDIELFNNTNNIVETLIIIWLQNRGILKKTYKEEHQFHLYRKDPTVQAIVSHFVSGLKRGNVILLIDSFDELSRMSFQADIFKRLFKLIKKYICASRPETYLSESPNKRAIHIRAPWANPTIKKYLEKKDDLPPAWRNLIFNYIEDNEQADWLKNPRYLNLLIEHIQHNQSRAAKKFGEKEILAFLSYGEYALFHRIFDSAFERIERHMELNGVRSNKREVESTLTQIAISQLETGNYILTDKQKTEKPHYWKAILSESSLIREKTRTGSDDAVLISLLNHNLVDYYISDDITRQVLDESLSKQELSFRQLWTKNLLSYVSQYMWEKCTKGHLTEAEVIEKVWTKIQQLKLPALQTGVGFRQEQMDIPFEDQFQTINLIQLLIQFETDRLAMTKVAKRSSLRAGIIFSHRTNFSDLDLSNIDLSEIKFVNCDFSGSILYCANLSNAVFEQCNFAGVNLRFASATNATFKNCSFSLPTNREDSAFLKFQIKGIALKRSYFKESSEELTPDILLQNGAIDLGSRYASKFGRDFLKNQKKYLGEGLKIAEDYYMDDAIMPTIKDMGRGKKNVILVDLMAGGNNDRIKRFFKQNTNLSILAVDKDTEQLKSVQIAVGYRFKVVKKTISGAIGLRDLIRQLFNTTFDKISARAGFKKLTEQADIIIGKKAIHEISRDQQKKLIEDCFQALSPGGRLILFTDSPPAISEEGFKRLQELKKLVQSGQNADVIRHELVDSLKLGDSSDDVAIFSNLWVLLKDWANRNKGEVQRRYFSSINEIKSWANEAGFKTMKEPFREHYDLTAKFFNEFAFNQIELLLERAPDSSLSTANKQLIAEYIKGTPRHKVFFDFAEHHLFTDKAREEHTSLGRALDAKQVPLSDKFREVNSRLENIDLPYQNGVSFRFSVHVVEFEKPK